MQETYPEAKAMRLTCRLTGSALTIQDRESAQSWTGTYRIIEQGPDNTTIYELAFSDGTEGHAVSGITEVADGSQKATLIVTAGDYTVNFSGRLPEQASE